MNRIVPLMLAVGLATTYTGCQSATDSSVAESPAAATPSAASATTLVTLKVPHMT